MPQTISSSEVDTSDISSSRPKDSSATESSQKPELRQDTLEEIEEEPKTGASFQIQHATEQLVDDLEEASTVSSSKPCEVKLESKTPPPSPVPEKESQESEG